MSTAAESIAPPRPWMPSVWAHDEQGLPIRHRPVRPFADLWESRCPARVFLFDFPATRATMALRACEACEAMPTELAKP